MENLVYRIFNIKDRRKSRFYALEKYAQIGKISSGLIHDLMSPITALNMQIELLDKKKINSKEYLDSIRSAAGNVNEYICLIKDYINNENTCKEFCINEAIRKSLGLISYKAIKNKIDIFLQSSKNLQIYGNPLYIYQIIINLVSNAIDSYNKENISRKVLIEINNSADYVRIRVQDFGTGIEAPKLKTIFDPFYSRKGSECTGIGLPATKCLIEEEFGGYIEVQTEYGCGSIFDVYLKKDSKNPI